MRQAIRGYTDGVITLSDGQSELASTAEELEAVRRLVDSSEDLRRVLADPTVPPESRRALLDDLFGRRVHPAALKLLRFTVDADRAAEFRPNLEWLVARLEAAARGRRPLGETVLGRKAAEERLDGYATAMLEPLSGEAELTDVEDELFRFMRVVVGSEQLSAALSDRSVPAEARRALVEDLLEGKARPTTVNLAAYATQVGRPRDYAELLAFLVDRVAAENNRRVAEVRAPVELDESQRRSLAEVLSRVVGRPVEVRASVDPSVLGGFVATIADTVVDGSARHRLEVLKERLELPEPTITTGDRS